MLITLLIIVALGWYIMTPPERERVVRAAARHLPRVRAVAGLFRRERDELLEKVLRERTPWLIVTPIIAVTNIALHWWMGGGGPLAEILGNFGPRTTNGEWWRLLTATFVHAGLFTLVLNMIAVVQVGLVLERLVGSLTFGAVYLAAAVSSGLVALSASSGTTIVGASGAVFGLYGLLVSTWMWGTFQRAEARIGLRTIRWCSPVAVVFAGVHLSGGGPAAAAQYMGLVTGFVCGVLMARSVWMSKPPVRRVATTVAAGAYLALVAAVPLRGVSDVRPALANVLAVETRTTAIYDGALREFRNGRIEKKDLAQLIDRRILPDLKVLRFELQALDRTPREHEALVGAAEIYTLRRMESWKIRSHALRSGDSSLLRNAEAVERAALNRLDVIR